MAAVMTFSLRGTAPLLMHNGALADPLGEIPLALARVTAKRAKTIADHRRVAEIEHRGSLWLRDGQPCIIAEAIEASLVEAARTRKLGKVARAGLMVEESPMLAYDGPREPAALFADERFVLRARVRIAGRATMRTRPIFRSWSAVATVSYLPTLLDRDVLRELMVVAGERIGLGDWRPKFGRFAVAD